MSSAIDVITYAKLPLDKTNFILLGALNQKEHAEEQRLCSKMVSLNTQVRAERTRQQPDNARLEEMEVRLQKARNAYETFQTTLYAVHPELRGKRGLFPTFQTETAAALIPDSRSAILEYVVTDEPGPFSSQVMMPISASAA